MNADRTRIPFQHDAQFVDGSVMSISNRFFFTGVLLLLLIIMPVLAEPPSGENGYWITIDPVSPHYIGETINITGKTNLPDNEKIWVTGIADQAINYRITKGESAFEQFYNDPYRRTWIILDGECMTNANIPIKSFFCLINTSKKSTESFHFSVSSKKVEANSTLQIWNRWMAFDSFERNVSIGDVFTVTGTTNAPVGSYLYLVVFGDKSGWMAPSGFPCNHCIQLNTTVVKPDQPSHNGTFAFTIDTSGLRCGNNEIWLYEYDEFGGDGFTYTSIEAEPRTISDYIGCWNERLYWKYPMIR